MIILMHYLMENQLNHYSDMNIVNSAANMSVFTLKISILIKFKVFIMVQLNQTCYIMFRC